MLLINLGANGQIPISILYDANILSEGDDDDTALLTAILKIWLKFLPNY